MSSSTAKFNLNDLKTALISVDQTDTRIRKRLETKTLGQSIAPHLAKDGNNFRQWSNSEDEVKTRNNAVQTFILKLIDERLLSYAEDIASTRQIFQRLASCFSHTSWSHTMNIFNTILNANEESQSVGDSYTLIQENLTKLKYAIGGQWDNESLMAIFFHHFNKAHYHHIANAIDARISVDPTSRVRGRDILKIAHCMNTRDMQNEPSSSMAMNTDGWNNNSKWFPRQQGGQGSFFEHLFLSHLQATPNSKDILTPALDPNLGKDNGWAQNIHAFTGLKTSLGREQENQQRKTHESNIRISNSKNPSICHIQHWRVLRWVGKLRPYKKYRKMTH
ncbi:hypothetical protein O181_050053 [Austropuccinia psidii MF-1]|uniref:Uncharacterized protein n=1 Tax=Austropuccinia psidii MF-1 TaxID=1389203 RepID=A0A9Q3HM08_9BASI|nr:hypothetical protein [Austropuccinia psidii MF-1]